MLARSLLSNYLGAVSFVGADCCACISLTQVRFRRRILAPPPWVLPKYESIKTKLTEEDREWLEAALKDARNPVEKCAYKRLLPVTEALPNTSDVVYSPEYSKRIGLIGRKLGMTYQWLKNGTRVLCTMIHVPENHVLQVFDPETWYKRSPFGKRKAFGVYGPKWNILVGAKNADSIFFTDAYRRIFERIGVPIKEYLAGFVCTEDAIVPPGTSLDVRHFQVGQFVTVSGKTIDFGFQGVVKRWGMKGQPKLHTTKSHRRVGSTGSKGDARIWPGRRLPGHMGYEWRHAHSLQLLRINPIKQVLYIKGCVPGDIDEMLLIKDELIEDKRIADPSFPTYIASEEDTKKLAALHEIHTVTSCDLYAPKLFSFNQQSIEYTEADETKLTARDKSKAKLAKVKK